MAGSMFKKFLPAFIPLAYELVRQVRRNSSHNSEIKKIRQGWRTVEHDRASDRKAGKKGSIQP